MTRKNSAGTFRIALIVLGFFVCAQGTVAFGSPPFNDNFADRTPIAGNSGSIVGTTVEATTEPGEAAVQPGDNSIWYEWTAPATGLWSFDTDGSGFDTYLYVFEGTNLSSLVEVGHNDDAGSSNTTSRVVIPTLAGVTYHISVGTYSGEPGSMELNWSRATLPANDNFADAELLPTVDFGYFAGYNWGATKQAGEMNHAGNTGGSSVWYRWRTATNGFVSFFTLNSDFDTLLGAYQGTNLSTLSLVAQNDDYIYEFSRVRFFAVANQDYFIAVDGAWGQPGNIQFSVTFNQSPSNDDFANAQPISGSNGSWIGSNANSTKQAGEPMHQTVTTISNSVWFRWVAPASGQWTFDTRGTLFQNVIAAYTGSTLSNAVAVSNQYDFYNSTAYPARTSFDAVGGTEYWIVFAGSGSGVNSGTFKLNWALTPRPANDNFADAETVTGDAGAITGSNVGATRETGESGVTAGNTGGRTIWYSWQPATSGTVTIDTIGSAFDTLLQVYTGTSITSKVSVASNNDIATTQKVSRVSFSATAGTVYRIVVDGKTGWEGDVVLNWLQPPPVPTVSSNDNFSSAAVIAGATGSRLTTNSTATSEAGEPNHFNHAGGKSVWFQWTAPSSARFTFDTIDSTLGTVLAVYTGTTLSDLVAVAADGEAYGPSAVTVDAMEGTNYYIAIDSYWASSSGALVLNWAPTPTNDLFADALWLAGWSGSLMATNHGATTDYPYNAPASRSVWYRWIAPAAGTLKLNVTGTGFLPRLEVRSGTNANGTYYGGNSGSPSFTFDALAGTEYQFMVDGQAGGSSYNRTSGVFVLDWTPVAYPAADNFDSARLISGLTGIVTTTNNGATKEPGEPNHAGNAGGHSIWFTWQAPVSTRISFDTAGSSINTLLAVYTGSSMTNLTLIAENNDTAGGGSLVHFDAVAGTIYQIAVDSELVYLSPPAGAFSLRWSPVPANDLFANATVLSVSGSLTATNVGAGVEGGEPWASGGRTLWYWWPAPTNGNVVFTVSGSTSPLLSVYTGSAITSLSSTATAPSVRPGTNLYIRLDAAVPGTMNLNWTFTPAPANDDFVNAAVIAGSSGSTSGSNPGASKEAGEPSHAFQPGSKTVWYQWTAPASGSWTFHTAGASFDTIMGVYTGSSVAALTTIASNDDFNGSTYSRVAFNAVAGTTYFIAVAGFDTFQGTILLTWFPGPANDSFSSAEVLVGAPGTIVVSNRGASKQTGEANHAGNTGGRSLWFTWQAPIDGSMTFETSGSTNATGSGLSTLLAIYTGSSVSNLSVVASNTAAVSGWPTSRANFAAVAGTTYYIAVDTVSAAEGTVILGWAYVPANDRFTNAIVLSGDGGTVLGISLGATKETGENEVVSSTGASIWYEWTAPSSNWWVFDTIGSDFDTVIVVSRGAAITNQLTTTSGNNISSSNLATRVTFDAAGGTSYRIKIGGYRDRSGNVVLNWSPVIRPANDDFAAAQVVSGSSGSVTGDNMDATEEAGEPNHAFINTSKSLWYIWQPASDMAVTFYTAGSSFDTALAVYTGAAVSNLTLVGANNNADGGLSSRVTFNATAGTLYRIAVDSSSGSGPAMLNWIPIARPVNDAFGTPLVLAPNGGSLSGTNNWASKETGEPNHAYNAGGRSLWFNWQAPADGIVTFHTVGSEFDTILAAYSGNTVSNLTTVAANDEAFPSQASRIDFQAAAGATYRIAVDGYGGAQGNYSLSWSFFDPAEILPDPPELTIIPVRSGETVTEFQLQWPGSATGFVLEYCDDLASPVQWQIVPDPVNSSGGVFTVTLTNEPALPQRFFRLRK